jgi:hypothetical protein
VPHWWGSDRCTVRAPAEQAASLEVASEGASAPLAEAARADETATAKQPAGNVYRRVTILEEQLKTEQQQRKQAVNRAQELEKQLEKQQLVQRQL